MNALKTIIKNKGVHFVFMKTREINLTLDKVNYIEAEINLEDRYYLLNNKYNVHSVDRFLFFFN